MGQNYIKQPLSSVGRNSWNHNSTRIERTKNDYCGELRKTKSERSVNFFFLSDKKLKKLHPNCNKFIENISKVNLECVDRFAPVTTVKIHHK